MEADDSWYEEPRFDAWTLRTWRRETAEIYAHVRELAKTDPVAAHTFWREARDDMFRNHPDTPLLSRDRPGFTGLPNAPYDPAFRFLLTVDRDVPEKELDVQTGTDGIVHMKRVGRLTLPGDLGTLDAWWLTGYGGGLFIPFRDGTCAKTTYGAGRYLIDTIKGADLGGDGDTIVIDFNFAYNASCAYNPAWACPLPQPENTLAADIPVGELYTAH